MSQDKLLVQCLVEAFGISVAVIARPFSTPFKNRLDQNLLLGRHILKYMHIVWALKDVGVSVLWRTISSWCTADYISLDSHRQATQQGTEGSSTCNIAACQIQYIMFLVLCEFNVDELELIWTHGTTELLMRIFECVITCLEIPSNCWLCFWYEA